jgi:hypothetical protein
MPDAWWIPCLFIFSVILWLLFSLMPPREPALLWLRRVILIEAAYLATSYILIHACVSLFSSLLGGFLNAFVVARIIRGRRWRNSRSARMRKVAKRESQTGGKYNSSNNELAPVVPFSKGDSHNN